MGDSKIRMFGMIHLILMTMAIAVYGFDIYEEPVMRIGSGAVKDARFSPDGRYLAVATSFGVEIRDAQTREQLRFFPGASGPVVFNHQTTLLVTGTGTIWDTADFTKIAELPDEQSAFAFTPDDRLLIAVHWSTGVSAWDTGSWQKVKTYSSKYNDVPDLSISPDGKLLCASFITKIVWPGPDTIGTIIIWEVESGREVKTLVDNVVYPDTVAFSPDGTILATHINNNIVLWDTQTWEEAGRFRTGGSACYGCPYSMEFQPGTRFLACPHSYSIELWDTDALVKVREMSGHAHVITSISFHPDGNLLATVSRDGDMKLWDVTSGEEIGMLPYSSPVAALAFSQDSGSLLYCGETRRTEKYSLVTGEVESILPAEVGIYRSMDFGANGRLMAVTTPSLMTIYNTGTGEVELSLGGQHRNATFSHDSNTLAILTEPNPGKYIAMLWDVRTQEFIAEIPLTDFLLFKAEIGDDGGTLAVITGDEIQIWDVATKRKKSVFPNDSGGYRVNMVLSGTGKLLAADGIFSNRDVVKVWDIDRGEALYIIDEAIGVPTAFAFSPDDSILVTGGAGGEMALWDMKDGEMLMLYHEHTSKVSCLEFSPDGRYLASGGEDGLILIWEVNAGGSGGAVGIKVEDTALVTWGEVKQTKLYQNYPNPFNPDTWIPYRLTWDGEASITIYDVTGQVIKMLDIGGKKAGYYITHWDGRDGNGQPAANGVYFYILRVDDGFGDMKKMVLLK